MLINMQEVMDITEQMMNDILLSMLETNFE
jgi:hypothetical protein